MDTAQTANVLGALALALTDAMQLATAAEAGRGAAAPAALVTIGTYPGQTIDQLRGIVQLSHSGTVRLVDRLAQDGLVTRQPGGDGRSVALYLSSKGEQTMQTLLAQRQALLTDALHACSEAEQLQLTALLEKIAGRVIRSRQQADSVCRLCNEAVCPEATCPVECAGKHNAAP